MPSTFIALSRDVRAASPPGCRGAAPLAVGGREDGENMCHMIGMGVSSSFTENEDSRTHLAPCPIYLARF